VLSVTGIGTLLTNLNTSTLDVALPVVSRHFNSSAVASSWVLLSYMLVTTSLMLVFGRLADMFGRRRLYILGLVVFIIGSLACGLAPNIWTLVLCRVVQAIGAASQVSNTTALLADAFPAAALSTGLGINMTIVAGSQLIGPMIGGVIANEAGWRWIFWFNVPVGIIGVAWATFTLRRIPSRGKRESFDSVGAALSFLILSGAVLFVQEGGRSGWTSPQILILGAFCAVAIPIFIVTEQRRRHPMLDLTLFNDTERAIAYLTAFILSMARNGVALLAGLFVQAARGSDPFHAGLQVLPIAFGMMIASPLAGWLAARWSARLVSTAGIVITGISLTYLGIWLQPDLPAAAFGVALFGMGFGSGIFFTPNTGSIMSGVDAQRRGIANGVRSTMQNTGFLIGTAISLVLITSPLQPHERAEVYAGTLSRLGGPELASLTAGYHHAFFTMAAVTGIGAILSLLRNPPPTGATKSSALTPESVGALRSD
jgi:EmrB/QacA subfamily drug resistance transporter